MTEQPKKLYPIDRVRNFVGSIDGRAAIVIAVIVFIWRAGYRSHSNIGDARGRWDLMDYGGRLFINLLNPSSSRFDRAWENLAIIAAEAVIVAAAALALLYAVRWVLRGRP